MSRESGSGARQRHVDHVAPPCDEDIVMHGSASSAESREAEYF
jgi:hypothetical protein